MNKTLATLLLCLATSLSFAGTSLTGTWHSDNAEKGALPGSIVLGPKGKASLAPKGQPEMSGTWSEPNKGELIFEMPPHGTAKMTYRFEKEVLVLVYDNGNEQRFSKSKGKK